MNSGFPGHAQDERQRAWDAAREAARRAGMSVNEWLDTTLIDSEMRSPTEQPGSPRPNSDYNERSRRAPQEDLSGVKSRLDTLGRQLEDLARTNAARAPQAAAPPPPSAPVRQQEMPARRPRPPSGSPATPLDQALLEIAERQHALDGDVQPRAELPRAPTQNLSDLEQQLRQITRRVEAMRPCTMDGVLESIRNDLAEIGTLLKEAMPRRALEALEAEVRALAARIDTKRDAGVDDHALANLERGLAEMRNVLRSLTPAESLTGLELAVNGLTQRIDLVGGAHDPAALEQLESAIVGLRAIVSHVASSEALEKLSEVVRELAAKVDQVASSDVLAMLEQRITAIADALESRHQQNSQETRDLDAVFHGLSDKLEQLHLTPGDHTAVHHLEDRIAGLVEKLDASDARLSHLEAIERGLAELLIHIEHQRLPNAMRGGVPEAPEFETIKREVQRNQDALEAVHGTLGHVVDRLSMIEGNLQPGQRAASMPAPATPAAASAAAVEASTPRPAASPMPMSATEQTRRPIDPDLPPDHPLEPGSAGARQTMSPAERIAVSEAALGSAKPPVIPDPGGKSNFIAAARRAARAASSEAALRGEKGPAVAADSDTAPSKTADGPSKRFRSLLVGASVVLLVLGSLQIAHLYFAGRDSEGVPDRTTQSTPDAQRLPETAPKAPAAPTGGRQSALLPTPNTSPFTGLPTVNVPGMPATQPTSAAPPQNAQAAADAAVTGSIQPPVEPAVPEIAAARPSDADKLPVAIGSSALRMAAAKGDPAAEFEIAARFADGRGVPQDWTAASEWFERAAKQGLVPAQFRLAGLYEKGLGVKKDLDTARRLYTSAAEAGHAKAMHNLAVLYAEGAEGKPDYQTSAKWFRKAASYGIADSQYNLGILYARGIGVEVNMTEAYKWFSLAAREGDADAAKKRDDVGSRLDQQALMTARAAVQVWTAEPQPEAATQVKAPAGGWDATATPSAAKRRVGAGPT
jgi:localization factor PodJL